MNMILCLPIIHDNICWKCFIWGQKFIDLTMCHLQNNWCQTEGIGENYIEN